MAGDKKEQALALVREKLSAYPDEVEAQNALRKIIKAQDENERKQGVRDALAFMTKNRMLQTANVIHRDLHDWLKQ